MVSNRIPPTFHRCRPFIVFLIILTIVTGLCVRSRFFPLSPLIAKYGGDSLWAIVVYFGCAFLFPKLSPTRLAALSLAIAWSVEFLQLYHPP